MHRIVIVLLAVSLCVTALEDFSDTAEVFDDEKWIALDNRPPGAVDWIPAEGPIPTSSEQIEEPVVKRRRVRKRKRRPQNFDREYQDEELFPERPPSRPRTRRPMNRPHELDQQNDQWRDEMMAEEPFRSIRPYKRRRLYPKYDEIPPDSDSINEEVILSSSQFSFGEENEEIKSLPIKEQPTVQTHENIREQNTPIREDNNRKINIPRRKLKDPPTKQNIPKQETTDKILVSSTTTRAPIDLKSILKQAGGISLSELLQQKNLTLQDLINGETHAISALTKLEEQTTEVYKPPQESIIPKSEIQEETIKPKRFNGYRRPPPTINRKTINQARNTNDFNSGKDEDELDKKVTSPFMRKEIKYFTDFKLHDVTTESTTERRIFVPSHPKYYTSINFKPNMKEIEPKPTVGELISSSIISETMDDEENSVETTTATSSTKYTTTETLFPKRRIALPPTLFKLRNLYAKTTIKPTVKEVETENYPKPFVPEKAIKIDINELFGITNLFNKQTTEGPLKISVDIKSIDEDYQESKNSEPLTTTQENTSTYIEVDSSEDSTESEKIKPTSAKDEIKEILSDTMSRENLLHILNARNMTLKELLEQRERGSSQKHLADIFHNQTREPEPKEHLTVGVIKTNERSRFSQKPIENHQVSVNTEIKLPTNAPELEQTLLSQDSIHNRESRQNQFLRKQAEDYNIINNPLFRTDERKANEVINKLIPVWRQAYTNMHKNPPEINDDTFNNDLILSDEASRVEEIENQIAVAVNGALNKVDTVSHKIDDEETTYFNFPYGVRSAIIASATIVGISLFVFVTIFIIFKLSQKKNKHLSYSNSLSSLKIRSPILETPYQKRIFESLMNSTLGRRKKISTISSNDPQSLQDYLWENDRPPF